MRQKVTTRQTCRSCGAASLVTVLELGDHYVSNFVESSDGQQLPRAPLELILCQQCSLLQLRHTTPSEWLYRQYWYKSGVNASMRAALADVAARAEEVAGVRPGSSVLDIGCNDGTLLRSYRTPGIRRVGFEPAENLVREAEDGTERIINDFFHAAAVAGEKFRVITSIAMFYDLEHPNAFVADVVRCLDEEGVWVIQMSYLPLMLSQNAFDNICHEHLEYYSLTSLRPLVERHRLALLDVETNDVNGGSFRIYVTHAGSRLKAREGAGDRLQRMLSEEARLGLTERRVYEEFARRVSRIRDKVCRFVRAEVRKGKKVSVYGASTKGNTLLQYFGLDRTVIQAAAERNPDKWGKRTVGTWIPIVAEEEARRNSDWFLVLPWHFIDEFQTRESAFLARGGKLLIPLPAPCILDAKGRTELMEGRRNQGKSEPASTGAGRER